MDNCQNGKIRLRGAKFTLYDSCGKPIACGVTNCNGELCFNSLPLGKYYLHEDDAPCGYEKSHEYCEVVIDKCSPNETVEFVNKRTTGSIKVINQENKGVAAARNVGLEASTGKYISFVDADDSVSDMYIKIVTNEIKSEPDLGWVTFPWAKTDTNEVFFDVFNPIPSAAVWAYVYTWDCVDGNEFREDWQIGEDLDWLKRVLPGKKHKMSDKVVYTYDWNANPDSLSKKYNRGEIKQERE